MVILAGRWSDGLFSKVSAGSHAALCAVGCLSAIQVSAGPEVWGTFGRYAPLFACQFRSCSLWMVPDEASITCGSRGDRDWF